MVEATTADGSIDQVKDSALFFLHDFAIIIGSCRNLRVSNIQAALNSGAVSRPVKLVKADIIKQTR